MRYTIERAHANPSLESEKVSLACPHKEKGLQFNCNPLIIGAPGRNRTHDPLVRSQVLYPTELRALTLGNFPVII